MPSDTFFRLTKEKQERLLNAALKEFSRVSFHEASINIMIEKAGISRGSFYMYFKDKEDIYVYLLTSYKNEFFQMIQSNILKNGGDLKQSFFHFFEEAIIYFRETPSHLFIKNVFSNMNFHTEKFIVPKDDACSKMDQLISSLDCSSLKFQTQEEIKLILNIVMHITMSSIMQAILTNLSLEKVRREYQLKLEMICQGFYRKDYEIC